MLAAIRVNDRVLAQAYFLQKRVLFTYCIEGLVEVGVAATAIIDMSGG